jgi:hypothetical protein
MHGLVQPPAALTPKQILAEKISLREKQKKILARKEQAKARQEREAPKPSSEERITLTPEMAVALLEHNGNNRPISDQHVHRIANQIKTGKWKFNGDTIKVAVTNDILDGQHRLWSVIEAQIPVETIIVYGIEQDAFSTIDTIRRMRSGADVLALNGATRYRNIISSALQWLLRWQAGPKTEWKSFTQFKAPQYRVENSDIEAAWNAHPNMAAAVERSMRFRSLTNASVLGFFYYVLSNRNYELAERMMATLDNPGPVAVDDPFYKLREYFLADHFKRKEPIYTIALAIKAANAAHAGRPIQILKWNSQGTNAEKFPELNV